MVDNLVYLPHVELVFIDDHLELFLKGVAIIEVDSSRSMATSLVHGRLEAPGRQARPRLGPVSDPVLARQLSARRRGRASRAARSHHGRLESLSTHRTGRSMHEELARRTIAPVPERTLTTTRTQL